jgi:membrane-associated phospholipid phosphatase
MTAHARRPRVVRRPRGLASHLVVLTGVSVVAIAACAKVGEDVFNHETEPFDQPIRNWMLAHQSRLADRVFLFATHAGSPRVIIPCTGAAAAWLWRRKGLPIAGAVVLAPAVASALFLAIKRAYARARPAGGARLHELTYAFPSGHATASAAIFGALSYVLWREHMVGHGESIALGLLPTIVIGSSRVYLDVHWTTDVLGGWSVGALVAALSAAVYERVRKNTRRAAPSR